MYDVLIIGAGVIGASIARELSKYNLKVIVIEKENDVCEGTSCANSAIIHSGYDPEPGSLKAKLNVLGNQMYDKICEDLSVSFIRNGSITVANNENELEIIDSLIERANLNGVPVQKLNKAELKEIEPNISDTVLGGLLAPTAGIINPFELNVALMENAMDNGVELKLKEKVINIELVNNIFKVYTENDCYETKFVINAAGVYTDEINQMVNEQYFTIKARKGDYFILDHFDDNFIKHTLFNVPTDKGKGVLVAPTTHFNYLVGPSSEFVEDKESTRCDFDTLNNIKNQAKNLVDYIDYSKQIRQFSGLRSVSSTKDFLIDQPIKGFVNVAGIQSPGLSAAPAIALMVCDFIENKELKENFISIRRPFVKMNNMTISERNDLIKQNPAFGKLICRCEKISEGEIVDAIHRNCGATTVKGVKKRVRAVFGKCQGGFCEVEVMKILARELNCDLSDIEYSRRGSFVVKEPLYKEVKHD